MTYRSVIRNFSNIGTAQAENLHKLLSLSMPAEMLKFCGTYYKNQLKRDPFVDELKMLDMLIGTREREGASTALTELLTNDAFVARTYADLLKKRKQLYPNFSHPCTLGEAANVASEYIRRARGEDRCAKYLPSVENVRDSITYPDKSCVAPQGSAYRMRLLPLASTEIAEADTLILMSPSGNDTSTEFRRKSAALLRNKELLQYVKGVSTVGNGGILRELLHITDGVLIQLSSLSPIGTSVPATTLCDGFLGCHILRVAPHQWNIVTTLLAKGGVRALPFASIKKEPQFVFVRDKHSSFVIDAHFLRSLNRLKAACAKLADESALSPSPVTFGGIGGEKCDYLTAEFAEQSDEAVTVDSTVCVSSFAPLVSAPYKTTLWSALATVASLCARGVPYSDQALSVALEFPADLSDAATVGKCISTVLGLYRVQTELGLVTAGRVAVRTDTNLNSPTVSVWSTTEKKQKAKSTFTKSGSLVYAVSPTLDNDGIPDFSALRQMLNQVTKFANEGKILSCRVLVGEAITDCIRKMSNTHTCVLSDTTIAAESNVPLCILLESDQILPLRCIGKVHPYKRLPKPQIEIPKRTDLICCEMPDIVIVSSLTDNNAMALAALLEDRGAHVSLFTDLAAEAAALSRAMLTTQVLILCPNAKLPKTKQTDFALDTLRRAGGILLSLSKNRAPDGFISIPNGIDEEILQKICL